MSMQTVDVVKNRPLEIDVGLTGKILLHGIHSRSQYGLLTRMKLSL